MIIEYNVLQSLRKVFENKKIVLFKGSFDLFHYNHLKILQQLSKLGDLLIVEVKTDEDIKKKKGNNRPIIGEQERVEIVDNIKCVDFTILANEKKHTDFVDKLIRRYPENEEKILRDAYLIELLHPDIVCTTDEVKYSESIKELCLTLNIDFAIVPEIKGLHTSDIINKIKKN